MVHYFIIEGVIQGSIDSMLVARHNLYGLKSLFFYFLRSKCNYYRVSPIIQATSTSINLERDVSIDKVSAETQSVNAAT
jgi:hypothetical protein